ncbi:transporter [Caenimonas aquaedulcis]|uniref:Transporter n=1 Tax=Caenimonas aquaedulcis TaxID=2793270 RepID=A0A931H8E5_9BURK|nr:transporter [Caenimonas aquaedulcis]MBG9390433.1 transporter [Caenimonas aquaedulcis]
MKSLLAHALAACSVAGAFVASPALAEETLPAVVPYRPSVSTPATLTAPGWLEVEAGLQRSRDDGSRRDSLPYTLKLAITPDWGIRIGGDAAVREVDATGARRSGFGDTTVVLKRRFAVNDAAAFGLEGSVKFATARDGLGSGHTDYGVNGIYSSDFAPDWHVDVNLNATRMGDRGAGLSDVQTGWAVAVSRTLSEKWGVGGELSGSRRGGAGSTSQVLVAASYSVSPQLVFDAGVARGMGSASGTWTFMTGLTFLAGRVF